jgi:cytochrome c-type biogenesis protein CcmH/NrfG
MSPRRPITPGTLPLADALDASTPLASLLERLHGAQSRFAIVSALLPAALRPAVRCGPWGEEGWVLLASHAAASAKLRQMLPSLQEALRLQGLDTPTIKVRIEPPS